MDFTSQICTNEEQSNLLLGLGLKKETADMCYQVKFFDPFPQHLVDCTPTLLTHPPINDERFIPAWSLHRLIEMYSEHYVCEHINLKLLTYDTIIENIRLDILTGTFNKEYLEE